jgi:hypothetical protein
MFVIRVAFVLVLLFTPPALGSVPWVFPGNFRQRLRISDLVVSGVIEKTTPRGIQIVDGTKLIANVARMRIDRLFQGNITGRLQFTWFTLYIGAATGVVYSGPPLANFRPRNRYLLFLKRETHGWVVAMPLYALEVELAPALPLGSPPDLSRVLLQQRYEAIAEELEAAALRMPVPPPGTTGGAATYFPAVFDLLGGCAEPFYRWFLSSPRAELRGAALRWLGVIGSRHMACNTMPDPPSVP